MTGRQAPITYEDYYDERQDMIIKQSQRFLSCGEDFAFGLTTLIDHTVVLIKHSAFKLACDLEVVFRSRKYILKNVHRVSNLIHQIAQQDKDNCEDLFITAILFLDRAQRLVELPNLLAPINEILIKDFGLIALLFEAAKEADSLEAAIKNVLQIQVGEPKAEVPEDQKPGAKETESEDNRSALNSPTMHAISSSSSAPVFARDGDDLYSHQSGRGGATSIDAPGTKLPLHQKVNNVVWGMLNELAYMPLSPAAVPLPTLPEKYNTHVGDRYKKLKSLVDCLPLLADKKGKDKNNDKDGDKEDDKGKKVLDLVHGEALSFDTVASRGSQLEVQMKAFMRPVSVTLGESICKLVQATKTLMARDTFVSIEKETYERAKKSIAKSSAKVYKLICEKFPRAMKELRPSSASKSKSKSGRPSSLKALTEAEVLMVFTYSILFLNRSQRLANEIPVLGPLNDTKIDHEVMGELFKLVYQYSGNDSDHLFEAVRRVKASLSTGDTRGTQKARYPPPRGHQRRLKGRPKGTPPRQPSGSMARSCPLIPTTRPCFTLTLRTRSDPPHP